MKKILIIDDDEDFLDWVVAGLSQENYELLTAETGRGGLAVLDKVFPDLIIIDLHLPDIDGFEICRQLKSNTLTAVIPIMMVTGVFKEVEAKEKGYAMGADDFLVKPFSYQELRLRVQKQLKSL